MPLEIAMRVCDLEVVLFSVKQTPVVMFGSSNVRAQGGRCILEEILRFGKRTGPSVGRLLLVALRRCKDRECKPEVVLGGFGSRG